MRTPTNDPESSHSPHAKLSAAKLAAAALRPRTSEELITRAVAEIIVERHARVRTSSMHPIRVAAETMADLDDQVGFTVQTIDASGDAVAHQVVVDREGRVRRIVTPS